MKSLFLGVLLCLFLVGCKNPVKEARANRIYRQSRRADEAHNQRMADSRALTEVRLATKEGLIYSGLVAGVVLITVSTLASSWYIMGCAYSGVQKRRILMIEDPQGKRFPVIIADNRLINISTGERYALGDTSEPNGLLVASSTQFLIHESNQTRVLGRVHE